MHVTSTEQRDHVPSVTMQKYYSDNIANKRTPALCCAQEQYGINYELKFKLNLLRKIRLARKMCICKKMVH